MTIIDKKMILDQYDTLYARLDQAHSVIVALAGGNNDINPLALYAPAELLSQAEDALQCLFVESEGWIENRTAENSGTEDVDSTINRVDLCRTLNEALSMADHSIDLIQCVRADLAGKPRPPLGKEPERVLP